VPQIPGVISVRIKRPVCKADYPPPYSAKIKNHGDIFSASWVPLFTVVGSTGIDHVFERLVGTEIELGASGTVG
jgi:hypothetical protein